MCLPLNRCHDVEQFINYKNTCFLNEKERIFQHEYNVVIGETGAKWDTFIIYRPGADNNRVRDSKQSFNLGVIFGIVTRAFNK